MRAITHSIEATNMKQVISKFDYFYIRAGDIVDVVETVKNERYADCYYKVTVGDRSEIHYLLFAECKEL